MKFPEWRRATLFGALLLLGVLGVEAQPVVETVLFNSFPSANNIPAGVLILGADEGVLYGTANGSSGSGNNFAFRVNRDGTGYQPLHFFGSEAPAQVAPRNILLSLLLGTDGFLYGTTPGGGTNGNGSVFRMGREGTDYTVLHSFSAGDGTPLRLTQARDGRLYGVGSTIFTLDTDGNNYSVLHTNSAASDGSSPQSALLQAGDGMLYGMMRVGGVNLSGTVFKINTNGNGFQVLHSFPSGVNDGKSPLGYLVQGSDGALYGTTSSGGTNNGGTVFKINTDGNGYTQLHSFSGGSDGSIPATGLTLGIDGALYGTTELGGTPGSGTVFKIGLDGHGYLQLYNFPNNGDGKAPDANLVRGATADGIVFYGTTSSGLGTVSANGTVFALLVNPPVTITPSTYQSGSNQTTLLWPAWAQGAVLQATTNVATGPWVSVTNGVPVTGIQVTNSAPNVFYRLSWPQ